MIVEKIDLKVVEKKMFCNKQQKEEKHSKETEVYMVKDLASYISNHAVGESVEFDFWIHSAHFSFADFSSYSTDCTFHSSSIESSTSSFSTSSSSSTTLHPPDPLLPELLHLSLVELHAPCSIHHYIILILKSDYF